MRSSEHPLRLLGILAALAPGLLRAELRVELIELPPEPGATEFAAVDAAPPRISTLSERFAGTGLGRHFVRLSPEKPFGTSSEVILYTDPLLLSRTSPAHTNVVVDLKRQRLYLFTGRRMILESEVSVNQSGQSTPPGFFGMTERVKNGPIAENLRTSVPYWMQLGATGLGLHGGVLYGYATAGACIRLPLPAAEILFEKTQEGTPVAIFESWSRDTFSAPVLAAPAPESEPPVPQTAPAQAQPSPAVPVAIAPASPLVPAVQASTAQATAGVSPPAIPAPLRAVSGTPLLQAPPTREPAFQTQSAPVSDAPPPPVAAGPASGQAPRRTPAAVAVKPGAAAPKGTAPEVVRLRNIFLQPPPATAARAPLFPAADKRAKRIDLGANRSPTQKRETPGDSR